MKTKTIILFAIILELNFQGYTQASDSSSSLAGKSGWKIFSEIDLGILAFTGGYANYFGLRRGPHSFELGYHHFPAPSELFSGKPDEFDLTVEYIYSIHYSYFWNGKTDKGLFSRFMYHNKKQIVTEKSSGLSKALYSDLIGVELGYVLRFYKGFYITPRMGALYYVKSPQGKDNNPVQVGNAFYDNKRHTTWDTYFIPTISLGYSIPVK